MGTKSTVVDSAVVATEQLAKKEYDGPPTIFWLNPETDKKKDTFLTVTITLELAKQIVEAGKDVDFYGYPTPKGSVPMKVSKPRQARAKQLYSITQLLNS